MLKRGSKLRKWSAELGHMINNMPLDDVDINREIKNLFYCCNVLTCIFIQGYLLFSLFLLVLCMGVSLK